MNSISDLISKYWKAFFYAGCALFFLFQLYTQIGDNSEAIKTVKTLLKNDEGAHDKDFKTWGERSDKRYKRLTGYNLELKLEIKELTNELKAAKEKITYIEGKLECGK